MNHYVHNKISDKSYLISEDYGEHSRYTIGLFVGEHTAAVIDSGWGLTGNLRKYIADFITDKPAVCLLTHPHPDHMGAAVQFDRVYMNSLDEDISVQSRSLEKRLGDMRSKFGETELYREMEAEATDCSDFRWMPVTDGQSFELGGISVKAFSVPGHTPGSMVFYCEEESIAFVGDTIGNRVMFLNDDSNIEVYSHALQRFMEHTRGGLRMYSGHCQQAMNHTVLNDILSACDNVLHGQASPAEAKLPPFILASLNGKIPIAEQVGSASIIYIQSA